MKYAKDSLVEGTVYAKSTDVLLTGTNACLMAVIHVNAYDESWKTPVWIVDVKNWKHKVGDPLHNIGKPKRLARDGIG